MSKWALYHDFDELKCEVIREAIKARAITDGEVICGDIKQLTAEHVRGFRRVHFFAGGGFWDIALNLAGWGDEPVWTGSCPCPSFSAAGKGGGFDDPRHLWPDWAKLIRECRPPVIFGEQADDAVGYGWVDLVQADLEAAAYAFGKIVFGACSVGAPHIRQRLYFCADTELAERRTEREIESEAYGRHGLGRSGVAGLSANPHDESSERGAGSLSGSQAPLGGARVADGSVAYGLEYGEQAIGGEYPNELRRSRGRVADGGGQESRGIDEAERSGIFEPTETRSNAGECKHPISTRLQGLSGDVREWRGPGWLDPLTARSVAETGATRGFWGDCDWWFGRDGKYRPIGPGLFPLAHGSRSRVGRLRLYGDAIAIPQAKEFIEAYRETKGEVIHGNPK